MKKNLILAALVILSLCAGAQSKAKAPSTKNTRLNEIVGSWKLVSVKDLKSKIDTSFQKPNNLSITFVGDHTYKCFLSENTCYGTYNTKNGFFINSGGCTKICCDDEISKQFYDYLINADGAMINNKQQLTIISKEHILTFERQQ
jgi:hypothetical protein